MDNLDPMQGFLDQLLNTWEDAPAKPTAKPAARPASVATAPAMPVGEVIETPGVASVVRVLPDLASAVSAGEDSLPPLTSAPVAVPAPAAPAPAAPAPAPAAKAQPSFQWKPLETPPAVTEVTAAIAPAAAATASALPPLPSAATTATTTKPPIDTTKSPLALIDFASALASLRSSHVPPAPAPTPVVAAASAAPPPPPAAVAPAPAVSEVAASVSPAFASPVTKTDPPAEPPKPAFTWRLKPSNSESQAPPLPPPPAPAKPTAAEEVAIWRQLPVQEDEAPFVNVEQQPETPMAVTMPEPEATATAAVEPQPELEAMAEPTDWSFQPETAEADVVEEQAGDAPEPFAVAVDAGQLEQAEVVEEVVAPAAFWSYQPLVTEAEASTVEWEEPADTAEAIDEPAGWSYEPASAGEPAREEALEESIEDAGQPQPAADEQPEEVPAAPVSWSFLAPDEQTIEASASPVEQSFAALTSDSEPAEVENEDETLENEIVPAAGNADASALSLANLSDALPAPSAEAAPVSEPDLFETGMAEAQSSLLASLLDMDVEDDFVESPLPELEEQSAVIESVQTEAEAAAYDEIAPEPAPQFSAAGDHAEAPAVEPAPAPFGLQDLGEEFEWVDLPPVATAAPTVSPAATRDLSADIANLETKLPAGQWDQQSGEGRATGGGLRHLVFQINDELYAVNLNNLVEIDNMPRWTGIPGLPPGIRGLINLRGEILSLLDLRAILNLPHPAIPKKGKIFIATTTDRLAASAFAVDEIHGITGFSPAQFREVPELTAVNANITATVEDQDKLVRILDVGAILTEIEKTFSPEQLWS